MTDRSGTSAPEPVDDAYPARQVYRRQLVATSYESHRFRSPFGRLVDWRERRLIARALASAGSCRRVLDLPAGTGRLGPLLRSRAELVVGADRSWRMLRQEGRYATRAVVTDAVQLPFADDTFDLVVSLRFMGHLPPPVRAAALAEMARVARQRLVVAFYDATPVTRLRRYWHRRRTGWDRGAWYAEPIARTRRTLAEQGFTVLGAYPIAPLISETWVLVLERPSPAASGVAAAPPKTTDATTGSPVDG